MPCGCWRRGDAGAAPPQTLQLSRWRTLSARVASAVHVGCAALPHEGRYRDSGAGCEARQGKRREAAAELAFGSVLVVSAVRFTHLLLPPACGLPDVEMPFGCKNASAAAHLRPQPQPAAGLRSASVALRYSRCLCIVCRASCAVPTCASVQPAGPRTGRVALRLQALQQGCWRLQQGPQLLSCQPGGAPARRESRQQAATTRWRIAEQAGRGALLHRAGGGGS